MKTTESCENPIYVSVGSGISLASSVQVVKEVSRYRVPEPTRQADIISREYLRVNYPTQKQIQPTKQSK